MRRKASVFTPINGFEGVYMARAGKLNCFALRLKDGGLCLYSPVRGMSADTRDQLDKMGGVTALLAPNHYHNKGLQEHADAYPGASLFCTLAAEPRLRKMTGLNYAPLDELSAQLADGYAFLKPDGVKTGEVWVQIKGAENAWIVTDAFTAELHPVGVYAEAPTLLGTFQKHGVQDAERFKSSALRMLEAGAPTLLLSCHGSPVYAKNLSIQLSELLADAF